VQHNLDIQDLSIILTAENFNPTILTPDFLRASGVVPTDWELSQPPILTRGKAQVSFGNGVNIVAQVGMITFSQAMAADVDLDGVLVGELAQRFGRALPKLDYRSVVVNPRCFVTFEGDADAAHRYITERILVADGWQDVGDLPLQASVNLVYSLKGVLLRLAISEVRVQMADEGEAISAVLFAGSFHHELVVGDGSIGSPTGEERLGVLLRQIERWRGNWSDYQDILVNKFLVWNQLEGVLLIRDA
jgi:hypothetical protein